MPNRATKIKFKQLMRSQSEKSDGFSTIVKSYYVYPSLSMLIFYFPRDSPERIPSNLIRELSQKEQELHV